MSAFEVGLRAQVKAAIKEQSIRAIRSLIALAVKYELFKPPPPPPKVEGVVVDQPGPDPSDNRFHENQWVMMRVPILEPPTRALCGHRARRGWGGDVGLGRGAQCRRLPRGSATR